MSAPLLDAAAWPDLDAPYALDAADAERFRRDGFVRLRGVITPDELAPYVPLVHAAWEAHKLDRRPLAQRDTYGRAFTQALNLGLRDPRIFRFAYGLRFARLAAELLGVPGVRMFLDEAFFKEPGCGPTPWHQDQPVWPFEGARGLTMWIPLRDATADMGTLRYALGSHTEGALTDADISDESDAQLARLIAARGLPCVDVGDIAMGDVTAHDAWTVHRAGPNTSGALRPAYALHFFSDGARVATGGNAVRARTLAYLAPELREGDLARSVRWRRVYPDREPLTRAL